MIIPHFHLQPQFKYKLIHISERIREKVAAEVFAWARAQPVLKPLWPLKM